MSQDVETPSAETDAVPSDGELKCRVTISNRKGLHARAAAKFVKTAAEFDADVLVIKNDQEVPGSSIMGLMMLAASIGCDLDMRATGPQAQEALDALTDLVNRKFDEE
ncbi:HPr family phosphocarrier protein [Rhodovibrionaceae bacterium A322]